MIKWKHLLNKSYKLKKKLLKKILIAQTKRHCLIQFYHWKANAECPLIKNKKSLLVLNHMPISKIN
jgi:hypothetical protein